jgi:hypothetical protein
MAAKMAADYVFHHNSSTISLISMCEYYFFGVFQAEEFIYDGFKAITLKHFKMAAKMAAHSNYLYIFKGILFLLCQMIPLYQGFWA